MTRSELRKRPGPMAYAVDELVDVERPVPGGERATYAARVIGRSRTHLHVRYVGTSAEAALTLWDTRLFVNRR